MDRIDRKTFTQLSDTGRFYKVYSKTYSLVNPKIYEASDVIYPGEYRYCFLFLKDRLNKLGLSLIEVDEDEEYYTINIISEEPDFMYMNLENK